MAERTIAALEPVDVTVLAGSACESTSDAVRRLRAILDAMGGSMEPTHEPGLPPHRRAIEDVLRSTIRFLESQP